METRKLPHCFFFHIAAAQSDRGDQGDNQEKFGQVSESPGQRNQNPKGNSNSTICTWQKKLAILVLLKKK